jgi:hypothetical protein
MKYQYDLICNEFKLKDKVFKVVCDQAAIMKSAFSKIESMVDVIDLTTQLLAKQRQVDKNTQRSEKMHKELLSEIDDMTKSSNLHHPINEKKVETFF